MKQYKVCFEGFRSDGRSPFDMFDILLLLRAQIYGHDAGAAAISLSDCFDVVDINRRHRARAITNSEFRSPYHSRAWTQRMQHRFDLSRLLVPDGLASGSGMLLLSSRIRHAYQQEEDNDYRSKQCVRHEIPMS